MNSAIKVLLDDNRIKIPKHIAIVCDGNGRWAKKKGFPRTFGHKAGTKPIENITKICSELGVEVLTFYVFSTENWNRPDEEVNFLMKLFVEFFIKLRNEVGQNIRVKHIGIKNNLSSELIDEIKKTESLTESNPGMILNIALNYGSRLEIINAAKNIMHDMDVGNLNADEMNEDLFSNYMSTSGLPDVDLIIRTSGEIRISNFLLWQSIKAKLWFTDDFWPDFKYDHLKQAIRHYNGIDS
ncbi:di-trans,poly-cis-decaprenylcistransferase [Clostridium botulinum]|uniref:Isoprenyl transferase n=1 Tax=Clostridium botulinum TaxID=1491 RepID=A0A846J5M3_CLOBO|nr:polyprenyl diphosphate synthase [Clostridium botulinum]ACA55990.1 di-trans,poly-cis-decaprenylcistransferase [Clostridium botulinum A3 str. Loch Maree]NFH64084.1 di-trans,poly-cis-decaprenylcistransferase [Clostridium botulinum]NFJ07337.1 di-trans,poly-cis-decaprenylcistransferase [Clostridium botulinum]NFK14309.1 di-trans,poly-cis-decaprenylcistransferase [Clostridium botulinum]NFM92759.1 di-trans,poly-cis-decaprenylcistransferase [Clostridium botulinum]